MLFSIITVTRNNRAGLKKTAVSLSEQEFDGFEWIIVDGASTDNSKKDFENYNATIISEEDEGPYDAMNKGLTLAKGEYVIFMNAGDIFAQTQTLKKIREAVWLSKPDFIYGDSWEFSKGRTWYKPAKSHSKTSKGMFTHHQSMIYKRHTIGDMLYNTDYKIAADYDFTLRFLNQSSTCLYLPFPLCVFEGGGLSQRNVTRGRKEQFAIRQKNKVSTLSSNVAIYTTQMVSWSLRSCAPGLYWKLKNFKREEESLP